MDDERFDCMETKELQKFAVKISSARSGSQLAAHDAETHLEDTGIDSNLNEIYGYLTALYGNVYAELEQREDASLAALDEPTDDD